MLAIGIVLLGLVGDVTPAFALSRAKQCRRSCADAIAQCVTDGGRRRRCRRSWVRRCKREGVSTCALTPPTTTTTTAAPATTTAPVVTTTTSTTTTTQPRGLAGLFGTWDFTYSIISTYEDRYVMSEIATSSQGIPYIPVYDVYDGLTDAIVARPVDLGFTGFPFEFALLDASTLFCDFFVFNKTGTNTIAGNYYLTDVDFDGSCGAIQNLSNPYPVSGVRFAAALVARDAEPGVDDESAIIGSLVRVLGDRTSAGQ